MFLNYPVAKLEHSKGPLLNDFPCVQFKALQLKDFCVRFDPANRGIMINNKIGKVVNIVQYEADPDIYVLYHLYKVYEDLYNYPLKSGSLVIYIVNDENKTLKRCSHKEIQMKYIIFPLESKIAGFPLIHTL